MNVSTKRTGYSIHWGTFCGHKMAAAHPPLQVRIILNVEMISSALCPVFLFHMLLNVNHDHQTMQTLVLVHIFLTVHVQYGHNQKKTSEDTAQESFYQNELRSKRWKMITRDSKFWQGQVFLNNSFKLTLSTTMESQRESVYSFWQESVTANYSLWHKGEM